MMKLIHLIILFTFYLINNYASCQMTEKLLIYADSPKILEKEISLRLTPDVKRLTLVIEGNHKTGGWTVLPPLSAANHHLKSVYDYDIFIDELPLEFSSFSHLKYLDISYLGLSKLPDFSNFSQIERLDISFNPISIKDAITNISKLKSLKVLNIQGCDFNEEDVLLIKHRLSETFLLHSYQNRPFDFFQDKPMVINYDDKIILQLLESIHGYYPAGLPGLNKVSGQYQKYKSVLDQSVTDLESNSKDDIWQKLIDEVENTLDSVKVIKNTFIGFPHRSFYIPFGEMKSDSTIEKKSLILDLSLLTNHYTIYIESSITFNKYKEINNKPLRNRILFGQKNSSSLELDLFEKLIETIPMFYPEYKFVPHQIVMSNRIEGAVPYGAEMETKTTEYLIYSLLFGPKPISNAKIIE